MGTINNLLHFKHVREEGAHTRLEIYKRLDSDAYLEVVMHISHGKVA